MAMAFDLLNGDLLATGWRTKPRRVVPRAIQGAQLVEARVPAEHSGPLAPARRLIYPYRHTFGTRSTHVAIVGPSVEQNGGRVLRFDKPRIWEATAGGWGWCRPDEWIAAIEEQAHRGAFWLVRRISGLSDGERVALGREAARLRGTPYDERTLVLLGGWRWRRLCPLVRRACLSAVSETPGAVTCTEGGDLCYRRALGWGYAGPGWPTQADLVAPFHLVDRGPWETVFCGVADVEWRPWK